jgi:hypothetical protein
VEEYTIWRVTFVSFDHLTSNVALYHGVDGDRYRDTPHQAVVPFLQVPLSNLTVDRRSK